MQKPKTFALITNEMPRAALPMPKLVIPPQPNSEVPLRVKLPPMDRRYLS